MNRRDMLKLLGFLPGMALVPKEQSKSFKQTKENWHHVVIQRNNNDIRVFIDGSESPPIYDGTCDWWTADVDYPK